jgi:hypothetical protein
MIKRYKKMIALGVTMAFLTLLPIYSLPLPEEQSPSFVEKEQQVTYQTAQRNVLPVILGLAAVAVGVFLLVILVFKTQYDLTGAWEFHTDFTTAGDADYDSVWTFTPYDYSDRVTGIFDRNANGKITRGLFFIVNKKEVVFQDSKLTEAYVGKFDSKGTLSGTFHFTSGAEGNWTAKIR